MSDEELICAPDPKSMRAELAELVEQLSVGPVIWYCWGGSSPRTGMDCSGLVCWCAAQVSVPLPLGRPNTDAMWQKLERVESGQEEPGDLALYGSGDPADPACHVMVLVSKGRVAGMSGGGSAVTSQRLARERNARLLVKSSHLYRKDFIGWRRLPFHLAPGFLAGSTVA